VTHFYDPLLAKLIVHAENREAAIRRMSAALREVVVHGVTTNVDFLQALLAHEAFARGEVSTRWVETSFDWKPAEVPIEALIAAAVGETVPDSRLKIESLESDPFSPWKSGSGFRMSA
jgi:acetyl/propionyl-CoA carboxylase alpha subunit